MSENVGKAWILWRLFKYLAQWKHPFRENFIIVCDYYYSLVLTLMNNITIVYNGFFVFIFPSRKFSQFFDVYYGNCFIFNSGWEASVPIKYSKRAGRRHGEKND
jgi:hypothetical protein